MQDYRYKKGSEYMRACIALSKNQPPKGIWGIVDFDALRAKLPENKITVDDIEYNIEYLDKSVKFSAEGHESKYINEWKWSIEDFVFERLTSMFVEYSVAVTSNDGPSIDYRLDEILGEIHPLCYSMPFGYSWSTIDDHYELKGNKLVYYEIITDSSQTCFEGILKAIQHIDGVRDKMRAGAVICLLHLIDPKTNGAPGRTMQNDIEKLCRTKNIQYMAKTDGI